MVVRRFYTSLVTKIIKIKINKMRLVRQSADAVFGKCIYHFAKTSKYREIFAFTYQPT